jgi:hypothetical protein
MRVSFHIQTTCEGRSHLFDLVEDDENALRERIQRRCDLGLQRGALSEGMMMTVTREIFTIVTAMNNSDSKSMHKIKTRTC